MDKKELPHFRLVRHALKDITALMVRKQYVRRDLTALQDQRLQLFVKSENIIVTQENMMLAHA